VAEISGGYNIVNWTYVGGNNFIVSSKKKQSDGITAYVTGFIAWAILLLVAFLAKSGLADMGHIPVSDRCLL